MTLNGGPFPIFDGAGSGLAQNPPGVYHAPNAQDLSLNNRDLWHENRVTGHSPPSSNLHPRYSNSMIANGGTGLTGVVTYGPSLLTAAVGGNTTGSFAPSEFSAAGFTIDAAN